MATCLPAGVRHGPRWCIFQGRKMRGVATNVYSRKTSEKPEKENVEGLRILKMRVLVLFTHEEGICTPRARHKGRQPLIECANHDFNINVFSIFMYFPFIYIYFFLLFWGRQGCCPCSYVSSGAMRKSDLHSSLRTECWLNCFFYLFLKIDFNRAKVV